VSPAAGHRRAERPQPRLGPQRGDQARRDGERGQHRRGGQRPPGVTAERRVQRAHGPVAGRGRGHVPDPARQDGQRHQRDERYRQRGQELPAHARLAGGLETSVDWDAEFEANLDDLVLMIEGVAARARP
jgi:hypothetical protein